MSASWAYRLVKRYNERGPEGLKDRRTENGSESMLNTEERAALIEAMKGPSPDGGLWNSPKVAAWIKERIGQAVRPGSAWYMIRQLGFKTKVLRPRHQKGASKEEQAAYKKSSAKTLPASARRTRIKKSNSGPKTKRG